MSAQRFQPSPTNDDKHQNELSFLRPEEVTMIDEALAKLGQFGEIRIIVEKGRLRFLVVQKSIDALKWTPGSISTEMGDI